MYTSLGQTGLRVSKLAFGCAPMMGRIGRKKSLQALSAALDGGITYFDTARSYGYGEAEALLGEFLGARRKDVVIGTKFGIAVAKQSSLLKNVVKPLARSVFALVPGLRRGMKGALGSQFSRQHFTPAEMRASVEESLQQLRTDYIDVLSIHSCSPEALADDELFGGLTALVQEGKVRHLCISTDATTVKVGLERRGKELNAVQFYYNLQHPEAEELFLTDPRWNTMGKIANQPFGGAEGMQQLAAALAAITGSPEMPASLRRTLESLDAEGRADLALAFVLEGTGIHVAVCSMYTPEHIKANIRHAQKSRFSTEEIRLIRKLLLTSAPAV